MKRTLAVVALMLFCAMALSGCTMIKGLERDVQVVLEVDGSIVGCEMVNIWFECQNTALKSSMS